MAARPTRMPLRAPAPATRPQHVALVVDDEPGVRSLVARLLTRKGWRVVEAPDALAALAIVRARPVDLVVTDYEMPALSGFELSERLRSANHSLPILMLSGHADVAARFLALPGGRVAFTAKPFALDELSSRLDALIADA